MNREVKLRAWDKVHSSMQLLPFRIGVTTNGGQTLSFSDDDTIAWMQFTGLKDKNGTEIYEGDILENDTEWWEVIFSEGRFECKPIRGGNVWMDLPEIASSSETNHCGNIYENPELLK